MENLIIIITCIALALLFKHLKIKSLSIQALSRIFENNWYRFLAKPFMLALPSATLACYKIEPLKDKIPGDVITWIDKEVVFLVVGLFMVPLLVGIEDFIRKLAPAYSNNLTSDGQSILLRALDYPVDKKMNHFLSVLRSAKDSMTSGQVFQAITQPDKQLAEITRAIHIFFESLAKLQDEQIDFTTVLFKMDDGSPVEGWCYFPESKRPEQNLLNDPKSLAANAAKNNGRTIIIQDIEKERKKPKSQISQHCPTEKGSAICYPIKSTHTKSIPLVLRITADKAFFSSDNKVLYEKILDRFSKRILIEYALSELKNYASKKIN